MLCGIGYAAHKADWLPTPQVRMLRLGRHFMPHGPLLPLFFSAAPHRSWPPLLVESFWGGRRGRQVSREEAKEEWGRSEAELHIAWGFALAEEAAGALLCMRLCGSRL